MTVKEKHNKQCPFTGSCELYQGSGLPENSNLTVWRNVFCSAGIRGWKKCKQYQQFEKDRRSK